MNGDGNHDITISGDKTGDGFSFDDTSILTISFGAQASLVSLQLRDAVSVGANAYGESTYDGGSAFGAIYNAGVLTVSDSYITNNFARGGNGNSPTDYAHGGRGGDAAAGIFNTGTMTVNDTLFTLNKSISAEAAMDRMNMFWLAISMAAMVAMLERFSIPVLQQQTILVLSTMI